MQSGHDGSRIVASYPRNQRQTTGIAAFDTFENALRSAVERVGVSAVVPRATR